MKRSISGFTLLEALVALLLLSIIIVAFLAMLETFSGMVQIQGNIADTTENMRYTMAALIRIVRMTGTGGLPVSTPSLPEPSPRWPSMSPTTSPRRPPSPAASRPRASG